MLIIGLGRIGTAFKRSRFTIARWIRERQFPAARLPSGEWITSLRLIEDWILERNRNDPLIHRKQSHATSAAQSNRIEGPSAIKAGCDDRAVARGGELVDGTVDHHLHSDGHSAGSTDPGNGQGNAKDKAGVEPEAKAGTKMATPDQFFR
jgi:hypothetical protein